MPQQIAVGSTIYLHRSDRAFDPETTHLMITAHGAAMPGNFRVPKWAALHFYGRHGAAIEDPGFRDILDGKYQVIETANPDDVCHNYLLSKYQGRHGNVRETYEALQHAVQMNSEFLDGIHEMVARRDDRINRVVNRSMGSRGFGYHFDFLTIRNRWHHKLGVQLSTVLSQLDRAGYRYENIHCSFCRWKPYGGTVAAQRFGS